MNEIAKRRDIRNYPKNLNESTNRCSKMLSLTGKTKLCCWTKMKFYFSRSRVYRDAKGVLRKEIHITEVKHVFTNEACAFYFSYSHVRSYNEHINFPSCFVRRFSSWFHSFDAFTSFPLNSHCIILLEWSW